MGAGGIGFTELLIILVIVLLLFGTKRLKSIGSDLGSAIKGFRSAMSQDEKAAEPTSPGQGDPAQRAEAVHPTAETTSPRTEDKPRG